MASRTPRRSRWQRNRDERGATFVLTAICMVLLLWGGAMGVDIGFTVVSSRQAQALADTGALDMTRYINLADNVAQANYFNYINGKLANVQSDNGAGNVTFTATGMFFSKVTGWTAPAKGCYPQFPPLAIPCTGVKVTATENVPRIFAGGGSSVTRSAIAAVTPEDGFSIGTYLASVDSQQSGVLNAILSPLGSTVSLNGASYEGLASGYVTVQQLITASGGVLTPSNVLTTSLSAGEWQSYLSTALLAQGASTADAVLSSLDLNGSSTAKLCQLVSINGSACTGSNSNLSESDLSASLNVLQTLTTEAELADGTSALNVQGALGITGVSGATLSLDLIQPPQIAYGPVGTTATTAQVSADLQLNLGLLLGTLDIPLTAAQGTATLTGVTCSVQNNSFVSAAISASTTTATAAVTLAGASLGTLSISGASGTPGFQASYIPPTASSAAANTNPFSFGTTSPSLNYSGSATGFVSTLLSGTGALLQPVLGPILQAAGVSMGGAAVADLNYNCGAVALVK
jgi:uncharacterized membrane protein